MKSPTRIPPTVNQRKKKKTAPGSILFIMADMRRAQRCTGRTDDSPATAPGDIATSDGGPVAGSARVAEGQNKGGPWADAAHRIRPLGFQSGAPSGSPGTRTPGTSGGPLFVSANTPAPAASIPTPPKKSCANRRNYRNWQHTKSSSTALSSFSPVSGSADPPG